MAVIISDWIPPPPPDSGVCLLGTPRSLRKSWIRHPDNAPWFGPHALSSRAACRSHDIVVVVADSTRPHPLPLPNYGVLIPCSTHSKEHFDAALPEDDLEGGFQFCSLVDEDLDIVSRDSSCRSVPTVCLTLLSEQNVNGTVAPA